jgi:hypothetical protein
MRSWHLRKEVRSVISPLGAPVDSRALYYSAVFPGLAGEWVDEAALQGTNQTRTDKNRHLGKG